jgi:hypothetical protein
MRLKNHLSILLVFLLSGGMNITTAQHNIQCIAVITEINGKAMIKAAGMNNFEKANWGIRLYSGDQVETGDRSEVKLLFSDNSLILIGQNSRITISGEKSSLAEGQGEVKEISSSVGINISSLSLRQEKAKDIGVLAGYRSAGDGASIVTVSPLNTLIRSDRPSFAWSAPASFEEFTVNLYNSTGQVWSRKVKNSPMIYPEGETGLKSGETYFWNVEGVYMIETEKSANHRFSVISREKSAEVSAREAEIRRTFEADPDGSSLHSILGAYYIEQGLLQDAIDEFSVVAGMNPEAPAPHEILGSLYSDSGEKDKAIAELQKALRLSDNKAY